MGIISRSRALALFAGCSLALISVMFLSVSPQPADAQIILNHIRAVKAGMDPASVDHSHNHGHAHGHDHGHAHAHAHGHDHGHVHDHGHAHAHGHDHGHAHAHDHGHVHDHGHAHDHVHAHDHNHIHAHDHAHAHDHGHAHDHVHAHQEPRSAAENVKEDVIAAESVATASGERTKYEIWVAAFIATLIVCAAPVFILPFIPLGDVPHENDKLLNVLLAFAAGGLLGDVFLHLLPHAMHPHAPGDHDHSHGHGHSHSHDHEGGHDHTEAMVLGLWVIVGIMGFFLIEKAMRNYSDSGSHGHSHSHGHAHDAAAKKKEATAAESKEKGADAKKSGSNDAAKPGKDAEPKDEKCTDKDEQTEGIKVAGYLNLMADFSHNFTDGLAIGASYLISDKVGFTTTVAILLHEVPHEIGDFAILVQSGFSKKKAMLAQFSTAIGALVGTLIGLLANDMTTSTAWILPLTAGGFIYIATTTVLPELLNESGFAQTIKETIAFAVGVGLMIGIAYLE